MSRPELVDGDPHDDRLLGHTAPARWEWPIPAERYNLVVIGGGPGGLVAALGAAGLGAKVALVERALLGGDCLVTGCVPSKALLRAAHAAHAARDGSRFGVSAGEVTVDFGVVMERMRRIRADIGPHDSAGRLASEGIDVFLGEACFSGKDSVRVTGADGRTADLRFARACIATGARAARPPIPGLDRVEVLTNDSLFALTERPATLTVVGAGVIGCEMAQAFARLGSTVSLVDLADRVLPREDADAAELVAAQLAEDGVSLHLGAGVDRFEPETDGVTTVLGDGTRVAGERVLLAVGRVPNVEALGLEAAGIEVGKGGIVVDSHLQTSNPDVYACGDVIGQAAFTHAADHQARIVIRNALFFGRSRVEDLVIPRVTYTQPEVAAVGLSLAEAAEQGLDVWAAGFGETDRGRTDGELSGFCRVVSDSGGRILGATVVGEQAGEVLAPLTLAMTQGVTLGQIASTIHPYPTRSEVVFKVASEFNRSRLTPTARALSERLMRFRR